VPFTFQPYQSPFTNSIAERIARRGDIAANAALQNGQAWSGAIQNIGQTVGQIPQQIEQAKRQQTADQMNQLALQGAQRQQTDIAALDKAYASGVDRNAILNALPGHLRPTVQKQFTDADEAALKVQELKDKTATAERDYFGSLAAGVQPFLTSQDGGLSAAMIALQHAKEKGYTNADELWNQIKTNPQALPTLVNRLIASSPEQQKIAAERMTAESRAQQAKTGADRLTLETPKIEAETTKIQQETTGTQPMTPFQTAELGNRQAALKIEQGKYGLEQQKFAQAQGDKTDLTPQGLDAAALNYAKTGQLPPLGMGDKGTRKAIINRAAEMMPDLDVARNRADFTANQDSLKAMQKQRDAIGAFETTAKKNIDVFLAQAGKVVDTGSPLANTAARFVTGKMLGSDDQAAYDAARQVAINEIAKITSNPTLSGTLSDSARHEVEAFNASNATLGQTVKVMRLLKQDMENRTSSLDDAISGIKSRIGTATPTPAGAQAMRQPIPGIPGALAESTDGGKTWHRVK
jgi:hypothetical protein